MVVQLDQVVPFGRSFDEYASMFALSPTDLQSSILSVADGPASFNAEGTHKGCQIRSIDPLYIFSGDEIRGRFYAVLNDIIQQVENTPDDYVWSYHPSPAALKERRSLVTENFCTDYPTGRQQGRYVPGELPLLSEKSDAYDLGLVSHFLFLYSLQLDTAFHIAAIDEMLRVCREVRIFPLLTLNLETSPHLSPVLTHLEQAGHRCQIEKVCYEFQRGGNQMLRIVR